MYSDFVSKSTPPYTYKCRLAQDNVVPRYSGVVIFLFFLFSRPGLSANRATGLLKFKTLTDRTEPVRPPSLRTSCPQISLPATRRRAVIACPERRTSTSVEPRTRFLNKHEPYVIKNKQKPP